MGTSGERREVCFDMESLPGLIEAKRFCAEEALSWGSSGGAASSLTLEEGAIGKLEEENATGAVVHQRLVLDGERGNIGLRAAVRGLGYRGWQRLDGYGGSMQKRERETKKEGSVEVAMVDGDVRRCFRR
ncbi:hypothetical protein PIB30_092488 [Stylosanthes scabra]|uniref:Uncharacterized protein n=1 Tax=Stylosanthes scabra TaxID=79078 RepID=A0ABU6SVN2_9FABA|nr:hypothetical protein [Stylosanthes scabra]